MGASLLPVKTKALASRGRVFPPNFARSGEDITADQLPVFGELLLVLARDHDKERRKVEWLAWTIAVLTLVLVRDAIVRFFIGR